MNVANLLHDFGSLVQWFGKKFGMRGKIEIHVEMEAKTNLSSQIVLDLIQSLASIAFILLSAHVQHNLNLFSKIVESIPILVRIDGYNEIRAWNELHQQQRYVKENNNQHYLAAVQYNASNNCLYSRRWNWLGQIEKQPSEIVQR